MANVRGRLARVERLLDKSRITQKPPLTLIDFLTTDWKSAEELFERYDEGSVYPFLDLLEKVHMEAQEQKEKKEGNEKPGRG